MREITSEGVMIHVALVERTAWLLSMIRSLLDALIAEARYRGVSTTGAIPIDIVFWLCCENGKDAVNSTVF